MASWHQQSVEEIASKFNVDVKTGIWEEELKSREETYGKNKLKEGKKHGFIYKFFQQMKDMMIIVLLAAAVISAVMAIVQGEYTELIEAGIILAIVVINALIGVIQENKAEAALDALKNMSKPFAKVIRGGKTVKVPTEELYPGDIVLLEAGDVVPADIRLIEVASLKIEESALTGESVAVEKHADVLSEGEIPLGDRINMAYSSGSVAYGRGKGIVVATGMDTEVGKIASMLSEGDSETPLQKQLANTAKYLSFAVLAIAGVIFALQIFISLTKGGDLVAGISTSFMTAVAIAVAAIPEGLPAVVTIVLAIGVQKMSAKRAIVRKLPAVETLGGAEVICSDKTGTLTLNKMTVVETFDFGKGDTRSHRELMNCMVLCNDTQASFEQGVLKTLGDPTETALIDYAHKEGFAPLNITLDCPRIGEKPFDSDRKLMSTINKVGDTTYSYTKGAPDILLARCTKIMDGDVIRDITDADRNKIISQNEALGKKALRVLAYAMKEEGFEDNELETNLIFVGLTGMIDPPRPEVTDAVATCKKAGMKAIMITGDHAVTAEAIATQIGILSEGDMVLTGAELDKLSDEEFEKIIDKVRVYARVSPENKVRIVKTWKKLGKVTAMTGDGVNDAPSIKMADIGIGMGITGTEVSKGVADIVLADDNFATIILAVEEGRKIYSNIRKTVQFLLGANIAEVVTLFVATILMAFGVVKDSIFTPLMILWINLVTDSLPAFALGMEHAEPNVMELPPRKSGKSLFSGGVGKDIFVQGFMQSVIVLGVYLLSTPLGLAQNMAEASTMAFLTLGFVQLFHAYNMRSRYLSLFKEGLFNNKFMNLAFIASAGLLVAVALIPPVANLFGIAKLSIVEWVVAFVAGFLIVPMVEIYKLVIRAKAQDKE